MSFSYVNPNGTPLTPNPNLSSLPSGSDGSSEVDPTILNQTSAAELTSLKLLAAVQPQITTDGVHLANGLVTTGDQAKINALPADTTAALAGKVSTATTVNGHALSGNVAVTTTDLSLNNLTNDAQTKAAIVPNTIPAAGQMLIGNAGGTAFAPVAASGDVTVASTGAHTIANAAVTNAKLATVGAYTLKGNNTASTAVPADIAVTSAAIAALPNLSGTNTGDQTISIGGDVTAAGGAGALTATVTKVNGTSLAGLGTGLLKNTTGTGVPSIATGADIPLATADAPGAESAAHFNKAESVTLAQMQELGAGKLTNLGDPGWFDSVYKFMRANCPAVTKLADVGFLGLAAAHQVATYTAGTPPTVTLAPAWKSIAAMPDGGYASKPGGGTLVMPGPQFCKNPATTPFFIAFDVYYTTTCQELIIGLSDQEFATYVVALAYAGVFYLSLTGVNTVSSVALTTGRHTWALYGDQAHVYLYYDGVLACQSATYERVQADDLYLACQTLTPDGSGIHAVAVGYP